MWWFSGMTAPIEALFVNQDAIKLSCKTLDSNVCNQQQLVQKLICRKSPNSTGAINRKPSKKLFATNLNSDQFYVFFSMSTGMTVDNPILNICHTLAYHYSYRQPTGLSPTKLTVTKSKCWPIETWRFHFSSCHSRRSILRIEIAGYDIKLEQLKDRWFKVL